MGCSYKLNANMAQDILITFEPHIKTLTESGRSHFLRPVDAIAEYIDNSIQACSKNDSTRNIEICLFLGGRTISPSFLVVLDDGTGMDIRTIKEFATYSLDQESRNLQPQDHDSTFIGKFGVGAKQAGFYLGNRIKLFTKPKHENTADSIVLYSFCLDGELLQSKYDHQQAVYEGLVRRICIEDGIELQQDESVYSRMKDVIERHIFSVPHGTAFIIRLRDEIARQLSQMDETTLATEIKEIYHFHIHPEHNFQNLTSKGKDANNRLRQSSTNHDPVMLPPLKVSYELFLGFDGDRKYRCDLNSAEDFMQKCVENLCDTFKFAFEIPLPDIDSDLQRHSSQLSQINNPRKLHIQGFLMYFPYRNGSETRPDSSTCSDQFDHIFDDSEGLRASQLNHDCIIRIYWQNRLVPESSLKELPFFPAITISNKSDITRNWKSRVVGCLFFDWEFNLIANNKLKLLIDLDHWLNNKAHSKNILFYPKNCSSDFLVWLEQCHKQDREYVFSGRDLSNTDRAVSIFKELTFRHQNKMIKSGDKIKFKGPNKTSPIIFAEVMDFMVSRPLSDYESYYFGTGLLRFRRIPIELFGAKIEQEGITLINGDEFAIKEHELDNLQKDIPTYVNAYLFETIGDKGKLMNGGDVELILGARYFKIGFQILNRDKKPVCFLPDSGNDKKAIRYSIHVRSSDGKDFGKTSDLWKYDNERGAEDQVTAAQKRDLKSSYYGIYNISMDRPGEKSLVVTVQSPTGNAIVDYDIPFSVVALHAERIGVLNHDLSCRLGQPFPSFSVQLYDCMNNAVPFEGDIKVDLTSDEMQVMPNGSSKECMKKLKCSEGGVVECKTGDWVAVPKPGSPLFSEERWIDKKEIKFSIQIFGSRGDSRGKLKYTEAIGDPVEMKVSFFPGTPSKIVLLNPSVQPIKVKTGASIPLLHFAISDFWNNRVGPMNEEDWKVCFTEGPIGCAEHITVNKNGEALCSDLIVLNELSNIQNVILMIDDQVCDCELEIQLEFSLSEEPKTVQIFRNSDILPRSITCQAGETLDNLSFELLNESGEVMDIALRKWDKNTWMECSWALQTRHKHKRLPVPANKLLPDLHIPNDVSQSPHEVSLEIVLDGQVIDYCLEILIVPAQGRQWKVISSNEGDCLRFVSGDYQDFSKKLSGVCVVDAYGNTFASSSNSTVIPSLRVIEQCDIEDEMKVVGEEKSNREVVVIPLLAGQLQLFSEGRSPIDSKVKKRKRGAADICESDILCTIDGFCLPQEFSFPNFEVGAELEIQAFDEASTYQPSEIMKCIVSKAYPQLVMLSSSQFGIEEPEINPEINVATFSKISDLCIHVTDIYKNEPTFDGINQMKIEILGPNGKKVYAKTDVKVSKSQAVLMYDFNDLRASCDESEDIPSSVLFFCKVSYKKDRELIELPVASLKCTLIKFNNVVNLRLQAFSPDGVPSLSQIVTALPSHQHAIKLFRENNKYSIFVPCGSIPPVLTLVLETDDGRPFIPELETFAVSAKRKIGKERSRVSFMELFDCEIEEDNYRLLFSPTYAMKSEEICTYELDILYKEQRPSLAALPDDKKSIKIQVLMNFIAGEAFSVALDKLSHQKLHNRIVSDAAEAKRRVIGENIRLHVKDKCGNITSYAPAHEVYCTIYADGGTVDESTIPLLYLDGSIVKTAKGVISNKRDECKFLKIEIAPFDASRSKAFKDGHYVLKFWLISSDDPHNILYEEHVSFEFTSDATYSRQMNEIQSKLQPLLNERAEYENVMTKYNLVCHRFKQLQDSSPPQIKSAQANLEVLVDLRTRREKEIEDMRNQVTQHRPVKRKINHPDPIKLVGKDIVGQVVDLGFVEDPIEAQVLSWASYSMIDAIVVHDTETAIKLYEDKVKVIAIDQILPYQITDKVNNKKRSRNEQELKASILDLPPILMSNGSKKSIKPSGNPRYLINILCLEPDQEYLRDSLFYNIFGNSILFDDFDNALTYRKYLIKTQQRPPTLFTTKGEKIGQNAVMDPSGGARMPNHLDFVFGEPKIKHIAEMHAINDLELLNEMIDVVEEMTTLKSQISKIDIENIHHQIVQLEEKQGHLQFPMSQR